MKARHPNHLKEKTSAFKCPIEGCSYQSVTKGNCLVHCTRRHFDDLADTYLEIHVMDDKKSFHCLCCQGDYKSAPSYYHHILKCLRTFDLLDTNGVDTLLA